MGESSLKSQRVLGDFRPHLGFLHEQQVMDRIDRGRRGAREEWPGPKLSLPTCYRLYLPLPLEQTPQKAISDPESPKSKTLHGSIWHLVLTQPLRHQLHHTLPSVSYPFCYLLNFL